MNISPALEPVLSRLEGIRPAGDGWMARCPAHDDGRPSLSISEREGRILMKCFAGCPTEEVLEAAGLEWRDLFLDPTRPGRAAAPPPKPQPRREPQARPYSGAPTAIYRYRDEDGWPLYRKARFDHADGGKHFVFERFGGWDKTTRPWRESWIGGRGCMDDQRRVLYNLDLLTHYPERRVYICEGEKCCDLLWDLGLLSTTNDDGAGKWDLRFSEVLRGRQVVVLPDNDTPGEAHGRLVAESLAGIARSVKILNLPGLGPGGDIFDWLTTQGEPL